MRNLTEEEVLVLPERHNLADAHAYRRFSPAEAKIIDASPDIFRRADRRRQAGIESEYLSEFFALARQSLRPADCDFFMCFTASLGLEVIANFLRLRRLKACLIEPCFDNLARILARHGVLVGAFPDRVMEGSEAELSEHLRNITADAVFLVTPNNPTGAQLSERNLRTLVGFCKRSNKLLILDACFRFYLPELDVYDQYQILIDSAVDFFVLEDTGKTWPTLEIKAPFLVASRGIAKDVAEIYYDFLLHASPFALTLLTEFMRTARRDGRATIRDVVARNRAILYEALAGTFLEPREATFASISWLRINNGLSGVQLQRLLADAGVHILPGNQFYWSDPRQGDAFVRVALVRDLEMFTLASRTLGECCRGLTGGRR